jgi:hypothetical protein
MRICFTRNLVAVFLLVAALSPQFALADRTAGTNTVVSDLTHTSASFSASITTDANGTGEYTLYFYIKEVGATAEFFPTATPQKIPVAGNVTTTFTGTATSLACGRNYQVTGAYQLGSTAKFAGPGYTTFSTLPCASVSPASITLKYFLGTAISPVAFTTANFNGTPAFQVTPSLPSGLSFNGSTGAITGTPTAAQTETRYTIRGTGSVSGTATATLALTVAPAISDLDALRYVASHSDLINVFGTNVEKARQHYLEFGFNEGRKITFNPLNYTASHGDLISAFGTDELKAVNHYIAFGFKEGRSVTFSPLRYIASHADLIEALGADGDKGVRHYINFGFKEGRKVTFDPLRYMATYRDLINAFAGDDVKATTHYIQFGYKEGRRTTFSDLDALNYIASYADLISAFAADFEAGLRHYVSFGYNEGRRVVFDALTYIASYGDLISTFGTDAISGAKHYINFGYKEGRRLIFDALGYLAAHADVRAAFGADTVAATQHFINFGSKEGRGYLWTVSATAGTGGRVSAERSYARTGEKISITLTTQNGYAIDKVTGCAGSLTGSIYTTGAITGTCEIYAEFRVLTTNITVIGQYQRPSPAPASGQAPGWETPLTLPIPNVWIELQNVKGQVLASGYADSNGSRTFSGVPTSEPVIPVLKSRALTSAGFDLWVVDNSLPVAVTLATPRTRYSTYELKFAAFSPSTKDISQTYTVTALTGWNSSTKTLDNDRRHASPFAIISDVIRQQIAVAALGAVNSRNKLTILWSTVNKGGGEKGVYDYDKGIVPGSGAFFLSCAPNITSSGTDSGCAPTAAENIPIVFLRGSSDSWIDDFDTGTIVHEMTHFTQRESQRSSSPGGSHDLYTYQDIRLSHHEGFATGAALIIGRSPREESFFNRAGTVTSSITDWSKPLSRSPVGWFQEATFIRFVWSLFDPGGQIRLSEKEVFAPYYSVGWRNGSFMPSIWAYGKFLKDLQPSKGPAIDQLGSELNITLRNNDEWGSAEQIFTDVITTNQSANSKARTEKQTLPVITTIPLSGSVEVCSAGKPYEYNYLSNRRYLRFLSDGKPRKYTITGPTNTVPFLSVTNIGALFSKGKNSASTTLTIPAAGAWGSVAECKVIISSGFESCSSEDYTPPEEQCWTIRSE